MKPIFVFMLVAVIFTGGNSFIIPDELPSILSLIYSNIPTIKKGTDSRLGWGFRLGDRADFQVLVELGPQQNTQPLANQGDSGSNKRNAPNSFANMLYAQAMQRKKEKNTISNTDGGKFIDQWSKDMSQNQQREPMVVEAILNSEEEAESVPLGVGEIDAKDVIPDESMLKLEELYGKKAAPRPTTKRPKTTTSYKDALDNVDFA